MWTRHPCYSAPHTGPKAIAPPGTHVAYFQPVLLCALHSTWHTGNTQHACSLWLTEEIAGTGMSWSTGVGMCWFVRLVLRFKLLIARDGCCKPESGGKTGLPCACEPLSSPVQLLISFTLSHFSSQVHYVSHFLSCAWTLLIISFPCTIICTWNIILVIFSIYLR